MALSTTFIEMCQEPLMIEGYSLYKKRGGELRSAIPFVGFTGGGELVEGKKGLGCWVYGTILSPNYISNDACPCRSHIEGLVSKEGVHLIEGVYNFMAHEGDCCEWMLEEDNQGVLGDFRGRLIKRRGDDRQDKDEIKIKIKNGNALVTDEEALEEIWYGLPWARKYVIGGSPVPTFFPEFLREIEEKGYDHPYVKVTQAAQEEKKERELEAEKIKENKRPLWGESFPNDIPF
jgi:hypothetical protein